MKKQPHGFNISEIATAISDKVGRSPSCLNTKLSKFFYTGGKIDKLTRLEKDLVKAQVEEQKAWHDEKYAEAIKLLE